MSLNRWAKRRDANEPEIIEAFEKLGFSVVRLDLPCDLIVGRHNRSYLVEVKTAKGKLKDTQKEFKETWKGNFAVVRSVEDVINFERGLLK